MKYLILFLISFNLMAGWSPSCESGKRGFFKSDKYCQKVTGESVCYQNKKGFVCDYMRLEDERVDDIEKPVFSKTSIESCEGEEECKEKAELKDCFAEDKSGTIISEDFSEIYCSKFLRYKKKLSGKKIVKQDATLKEEYLAKKQAEKIDQIGMETALKSMDCGKRVMARMLLQNSSKDLKKNQIRLLVKTYKDIKSLLETGSILSAKEDILGVTIDGILVTEADKAALVKELDSCNPIKE